MKTTPAVTTLGALLLLPLPAVALVPSGVAPLSTGAPFSSSTASQAADTTGTVAGRVLEAETESPISGADVELTVAGERRSVVTGPAGDFRFDSVPTGRHVVRASAAGYGARQVEVTVPRGDTVRLELTLARAEERREAREGLIAGRVLHARTGAPVAGASVRIRDIGIGTLADSLGRYRLADVPPGRHTLVARRLGFAANEVTVRVPVGGTVNRDIPLGQSPLQMEELQVTAELGGRARGELGTASVIEDQAIENQTAASLSGVLELIPGEVLAPPGLDGTQQLSLRSVPTPGTSFAAATSLTRGRSGADLASFGTSIVLDGVPVSNNANFQTLGPRSSRQIPTSAGGGIDLRRIPASTLERVEVIRGVPSVRYGDLTQGAVVVYTKAGDVEPRMSFQLDPRTASGATVAGTSLGGGGAGTMWLDLTRTRISPGLRDALGSRIAGQLSHRAELGTAGESRPAVVLDTRLDIFQLLHDVPLRPEINPGSARQRRDRGLRLSERARLRLGDGATLRLTGAFSYERQDAFTQNELFQPATPFTDRVQEGQEEGFYLDRRYLSRIDIEGDGAQLYMRSEGDVSTGLIGLDHRLRGGLVLRREWVSGAGRQFDLTRPPDVRLGSAQGPDRPRSLDAVPPLVTSALYLDDRVSEPLFGGDVELMMQAGLRVDLLHRGDTWASEVRDAILQPRLNLQLAPLPWLSLRAGAGRTAKLPSMTDLYPAPQYWDLVNVNHFANDPDERLAILTTRTRDPTNPDLGFVEGRKREVGLEVSLGQESFLSLVAFDDRVDGGVGIDLQPDFLLREEFTTRETDPGLPPEVIEPPADTDTVPILVQQPANNLVLESRGLELTAALPEIAFLNTRFEVQASWAESEFFSEGLDFGPADVWSDFQRDESRERSPFWGPKRGTGELGILTYRGIYHQPEIGLVVTGIVQHWAKETQRTVAAADTLAWQGYVTRDGRLVDVPREERSAPRFRDLRRTRSGLLLQPRGLPSDWILSLRVAKTLPLNGRLSFYAFNSLDREGKRGNSPFAIRRHPAARFGLEVRFPPAQLFR